MHDCVSFKTTTSIGKSANFYTKTGNPRQSLNTKPERVTSHSQSSPVRTPAEQWRLVAAIMQTNIRMQPANCSKEEIISVITVFALGLPLLIINGGEKALPICLSAMN